MPGRKNHQRAGMLHQHILKRFEQQRFFSVHRAAAYQHRPGASFGNRVPQPLHDRGRSRRGNIELQIPRDPHPLGARTNILQASSVLLRLRQE